ncbi:MAG: FAD-binding oxidoreductase [Ectothiorhodospiraceae bacterium]|nr:FAD-binding oxidoreductase [Ectothiorhodospiraceae bacterium]
MITADNHPVGPEIIERLKAAVGARGFLEAEVDKAPFLVDWRGMTRGTAPLVLRPASTEEVAAVVGICAEAGIGVVPQGGNTGMMAGSVPTGAGGEVVLCLGRMNRIREVDPINYTMTVEAGCVLADVQRAAEEAGRLFPLSLAAEGSCQVGGNLSTNAGGTAVLRYGNARDLVLGLEVVLPDGRIWSGLRRLRKDNTGYDLKQIFLGAEGTLGIITAAVLKLFPRPAETCTAMVAVRDPAAATALLARLREATGDAVTTFEYMHRLCFDLVLEMIDGTTDPIADRHVHYALVELSAGREGAGLRDVLEAVLGEAFESGAVLDATIAASDAQAQALWRMRESIPEANTQTGGCIRHDVSVPVSRVAEFLEQATRLCEASIPGVRVSPFGHLGDGNIHFNLVRPVELAAPDFLALKDQVTPRVHDLVMAFDGSFSAEHGIGIAKRAELARYRTEVELDLMRALKAAIDPRGIMNRTKVLPTAEDWGRTNSSR